MTHVANNQGLGPGFQGVLTDDTLMCDEMMSLKEGHCCSGLISGESAKL